MYLGFSLFFFYIVLLPGIDCWVVCVFVDCVWFWVGLVLGVCFVCVDVMPVVLGWCVWVGFKFGCVLLWVVCFGLGGLVGLYNIVFGLWAWV